jgi:hypothetical protein
MGIMKIRSECKLTSRAPLSAIFERPLSPFLIMLCMYSRSSIHTPRVRESAPGTYLYTPRTKDETGASDLGTIQFGVRWKTVTCSATLAISGRI